MFEASLFNIVHTTCTRHVGISDTHTRWSISRFIIFTIVWFLGRWYIGPTAMPRAAVTPLALLAWQPPEALLEGRYTSVAAEQNHVIFIITTWSYYVSSFYKLFILVGGVVLIPDTVCKSRSLRRILSRLRADLDLRKITQTMAITWCAHTISGRHF